MNAKKLTLIAAAIAIAPLAIVFQRGANDVTTGAETSPPTARAVGLMINSPIGGGSEDFPDLAFFGSFDQTRVAIKVDYPSGGLIDLRREESTLTVFSDDRGTDLRSAENHFGPFEMNARVAEDGRSVVLVVPSKKLPQAGASRLKLAGEVVLRRSESKKLGRSESVELAQGTSLSVGPYELEITETGESSWSDGWSLTLRSSTDLSAIVRFALVDTGGAEIELSESMSISGGGTWNQTLECEQKVVKGSLLVEYWDSPETVRVPFDLSVGLGLQ